MDYDYFCRRCTYYDFSFDQGVLCKLTNQKPCYQDKCHNFIRDLEREQELIRDQKRIRDFEARGESNEFFAIEKKGIEKGILGGIIMMGIALIWFLAGLTAGYIFFYPPVLFIIGVYAFVKGLMKGNFAGKSKNYNPYQNPERKKEFY